MSKLSNDQQQAPKRVKVTLACALCRKKKVKCDGVQPSCSRCQTIGNCCQYSDPPKKRGPPKGYVEVIENRAHRIESLLGNQQQHNQHTTFNFNKSNNTISNNIIHVSADNKTILQSNLNRPNEKEFQQPVNALVCLIADAVRLTASNNLVHGSHGIIYDFLMTPNVLIPTEQDDKHICNIINTTGDDRLPLAWVENFFTHFNFIFPILSRPQFTFQLERNELNPLLKLAVFTLGCKLGNSHPYEEKLLFNQFLVSHDLTLVPDLSTVQATLIMCWYTYIIGDINKCNSFRHRLCQFINELSFGYESDNTNIHFTEMKRRAFWVTFVIDQWLASCTGGKRMLISTNQPWDCKWPQLEDNQLFALHYQQQQRQQPSFINNSSYFSIESALQINSFNEMIRLSQIVSDVCNGDNLHNLEANLTEWLLHLPSYLDYGKPTSESNGETSPISKLYRILYYTVQIMINNSNNKNNINGITTSICTTAANTIIHISEQMVERGQQKYLYNVFLLSLTLATSIHLDNTIEKVENASDKISLHKSVSLIKDVNCTLLPSDEFKQLMDHFLIERCRILPDDTIVYPSPTNSSTLLPRKNSNNKRMLPNDEDDYQSALAMNSPSSLYSSLTDIQENISMIDYTKSALPQQKTGFDFNEILFPNMIDTLSTTAQQWPEWIFDNQPNIESSTTTCSPVSYITPSQSPSLSLSQKEEEESNLSFELLSNQHFFTLL